MRFSPGCGCCCICDACNESTPLELEVYISGIRSNGCEDCGDFNGIFICRCTMAGTFCNWYYDRDEAICDSPWVRVELGGSYEDGTRPLSVYLVPGVSIFRAIIDDFDCRNWTAIPLDIFTTVGMYGCDMTDAQCYVSAVR